MKDIDKIWAKVEKRKIQLGELYKKDEENYDLWMGKEQIFDKHPMSVNLTGTELISLALKIQASLVRSRLAIHVLPPDKYPNPDAPETANQEERMHYYGFQQADERLANIGEAPLLPSIIWQAVVLGRIAVRSLVYEGKDGIVWDYLPLNPRFLTFAFDSKGLAWACYETFRSAESIYDEYKVEVEDDGRGVSVSDHYDRDHNVRFLTKGKRILGKVWKNQLGHVPIIIRPVTIAPKAMDMQGTKVTSWGESVFDHVKIPFRNLNKMRSIAATQAHLIAKAPLEVIYEDGTQPNLEAENIDYYAGAKLSHPRSTTLGSMKIADIPASLITMMGDLAAGIRAATYNELNPDDPGHSGSALRILGQDKQDIVDPRGAAVNDTITRICRMSKEQIISQGLSIPVKTVVNKTYSVYDMSPELLDNDFYVNAELVRQDVYDEVEALQRAQMLMSLRLMSKEDILERVLKEPDTQTQLMKLDIEDIENAIPEVRLRRMIKSYQEREMHEDAKQLMEKLALLEMQEQQALGGLVEPNRGDAQTPQGEVSLAQENVGPAGYR